MEALRRGSTHPEAMKRAGIRTAQALPQAEWREVTRPPAQAPGTLSLAGSSEKVMLSPISQMKT